MAHPPERASIFEVGPRDGLQAEANFVPTDWIPQLADAEEVMTGIDRRSGVEYNALVANQRGLERAVASEVAAPAWISA